MTAEMAAESGLDAIRGHLTSRGVTSVAIIDDAYDEPHAAALAREDVNEFLSAVDEEELGRQLDGLLGRRVTSPGDIDDGALVLLWEHRDTGDRLAELCNEHLFGSTIRGLNDVRRLAGHLTALGLSVIELGVEGKVPEDVQLIFLDYYLGLRGERRAAEQAEATAQRVREHSKVGETPFFVLMSSLAGVGGHADEFRLTSRLVPGLFDFVPKEDLIVEEKLHAKLVTWAIGLPARHTVQRFVDALLSSSEAAQKMFRESVLALGLEDYAHIEQLSLLPDGQPLGEYMRWLFGALVAHQVCGSDGVRRTGGELDRLTFNALLPFQRQPSLHLAEIYRIALCDPAPGELGPHPWAQGTECCQAGCAHLHLGDIFIKDAVSDIYMVVSAACDLEFSPAGRRPPDPARSVLLMPGRLQPPS